MAEKLFHRFIITVFILGIVFIAVSCEKHAYKVYNETHHSNISYFDYLFFSSGSR